MTPRMSWEAYRAIDALNFSTLKHMDPSPRHYRQHKANPTDSDTFRLGAAAHCAVLEPARFSTDFVVWDRRTESDTMAPRRGQHWDLFKSQNRGRTIISPDDQADAMTMQRAIRSSPSAMKYLAFGEPEVTIEWMHGRRSMKGRIDWLTQIGGIWTLVGIKTAANVRLREFRNHAAKFLYHWQWAMYFDGFESIHGRQPQKVEYIESQEMVVETNPRVIEIVVEKKPPHDVIVYSVGDEVLQKGRDEYQLALQRLQECERDDYWPGIADQEIPFVLPDYMMESESDLADIGLEI